MQSLQNAKKRLILHILNKKALTSVGVKVCIYARLL